MAAASLFLAAKVEEQPRKLEHVIKVAHMCLNRDQPSLDTKSEVSELSNNFCVVQVVLMEIIYQNFGFRTSFMYYLIYFLFMVYLMMSVSQTVRNQLWPSMRYYPNNLPGIVSQELFHFYLLSVCSLVTVKSCNSSGGITMG
jgi:hypothetical protein